MFCPDLTGIIRQCIGDVEPMHCGIYFNHGLYDITGKINAKGYVVASDKDKLYMRKHFIPVFDVLKLEQHVFGQADKEERECLRKNSIFLVKR